MAFDVGQRLLGDTVQRDLRILIQPVAKHHGVKGRFDPGSGLKIMGQRLERGAKAQIVQHAGAQIAADPAHFGNGGGQVLDALIQRFFGRIRGAGFQPAPRDVQGKAHPDKDLADAIVQFPRHAPAFLFLRVKHPLGQSLQLGIGQPAFADVDDHA